MQQAIKCLIVQDGIICLIDSDYIKNIEDVKDEDISISVGKDGVVVILKGDFVIPIPEAILDYMVDNENITLYTFSPANYIEEPIITIKLSRDAIIEARGIYKYSKESSINDTHRT